MAKLFVEVIAAPAFDDAARARFASKKNLRLVEISESPQTWVLKNVSGGILVQDADLRPLTDDDLRVVTRRPPTAEERRALLFAWKVCKHVKSNAILYARDGQTVGVGAGQMSRVDACRMGAMKAVLPLRGTVAASDAFFPFPDSVEEIAKAGAVAIIQPGGSVRDSGSHRGGGPAGSGDDLHWRQTFPPLGGRRAKRIRRPGPSSTRSCTSDSLPSPVPARLFGSDSLTGFTIL